MKSASKRIGWWIMTILAFPIGLYAFAFFLIPELGDPVMKERFLAGAMPGAWHVLGGAVAILIGPFQFSKKLRMARANLSAGRAGKWTFGAVSRDAELWRTYRTHRVRAAGRILAFFRVDGVYGDSQGQ